MINPVEAIVGRHSSARLRTGCYLLRLTPVATWLPGRVRQVEGEQYRNHFDGTFRVQRPADAGPVMASGDLYWHQPPGAADLENPDLPQDWPLLEHDPALNGIPVFPHDAYRYYVRVIQLLETAAPHPCVQLRFELHEFDASLAGNFANRGCFFATLTWSRAPRNYPSAEDFLTGEVRDASDAVIGFLTIGWISTFFRRLTVEIDRVEDSSFPLDDGGRNDWKAVLEGAGWDVTVETGDTNVPEPSGEAWSTAELHAAMRVWRQPADRPDREWRFHLLCVRRLDPQQGADDLFGVMYDRKAIDSTDVPREGAAIASHQAFRDEPRFGRVRGLRLGLAAAPFFRTAVHELGHAFGLVHDKAGFHIMRQTPDIASGAASVGLEFPDNIDWSFSDKDGYWLRHAPDPFVRPGGAPWNQPVFFFHDALESPTARTVEQLDADVAPVADALPLGAPARIHLTLTNRGPRALRVPASLSLKAGSVSGRVIDDAGVARTFRSLLECFDNHALVELPAGGSLEHSFTLLRGFEGALLPRAGTYRVEIDVRWHDEGVEKLARGSCRVDVSKPRNAAHESAANKIIQTPEAMLALVLAGDHLTEGLAAIQSALGNAVLRPHYAAIEARRLARSFQDRPADVAAAAALLDEATVLTPSELQRLALLAKRTPPAARADMMTRIRKAADRATVGRTAMRSLVDS